jgi:plasmid stabilization system protein ParE
VRVVRFLRPAEVEANDAVEYFDDQRNGLGDRFEQDLLETLAFVRKHPLSGKRLTKVVRRFPMRTFRYSVIYAVDDDEIVVVAVAHHRRRPAYWRDRLALIR